MIISQKWSNLESINRSALRTLHVAKLQAQATVREQKWSRTSWWIDHQELRDGLTERILHGERILRRSRCDWAQPRCDLDGIGKFVSPIPTQERWKSLRSDWWATVLGTLLLLLFSWLHWQSWLGKWVRLCCSLTVWSGMPGSLSVAGRASIGSSTSSSICGTQWQL